MTTSPRITSLASRAGDAIVERTGAVIIGLGACMLLAYLASIVFFPKPGGRVVFGDATHDFVQLRSLVFDHDLDLRNEYMRLYGLQHQEPGTEWIFTELTPTGRVRNYMPIGPALLSMPLYVLVAGAQALLAWLGLGTMPDGFGRALQAVPGVTGVAAVTAGAWLSWRLARREATPAAAAGAILGIWLGSHALYYSLVSPSYSHTASIFTGAVFLTHWLRTRDDLRVRRAFWSGMLAGCASLMRWQDGLFLILPAYDALLKQATWPRRAIAAAAAATGWLVAFSPQMAVWTVLYGRPLTVPQGGSFMQWTAPHPLAVLFSDNHGLLTWTPVVALALVGLVTFLRRQPSLAAPLALLLLASWYVNAAVADWWAGESFGARRFLSLFPLFVVGLALWLSPDGGPLRRWRVATMTVLIAANLLLLLQYEMFMKGWRDLAPYPRGGVDLWLARFVVPFRLAAWWIK